MMTTSPFLVPVNIYRSCVSLKILVSIAEGLFLSDSLARYPTVLTAQSRHPLVSHQIIKYLIESLNTRQVQRCIRHSADKVL